MLLIEPWCIFEEQRHVMVVLLLTIHGNTGNFIADEAVNIMRINKAHTADTDGQLFAGVAIIQRLALLFQLGDLQVNGEILRNGHADSLSWLYG